MLRTREMQIRRGETILKGLKGTADTIPPDARAVLRINLVALRANWAKLNAATGVAECAGVVKADAYGLGIEEIVRALSEEGCRSFFVATLEEGRRTRQVNPNAHIYVLDGLLPNAAEYYADFNLRPVLASFAEVEDWAKFCNRIERRLPAALHVDTGINRLGMPAAEVARVATFAPFETIDLALIVSHLAYADELDNPHNQRQRAEFDRLRELLPPARSSLANSAGVFLGKPFHYDLVRPGIALYGGRAFKGQPHIMHPVVRLDARILQVRELPAGDTVGYGGTWRSNATARIATLACGYADGVLRALSGPIGTPGPTAYLCEHPVPIVGCVSMDLITVDVTNVPAHLVQRGGWVELIGDRVTVDDLADHAGTIGYELLCRLSDRVHRVWLKAAAETSDSGAFLTSTTTNRTREVQVWRELKKNSRGRS